MTLTESALVVIVVLLILVLVALLRKPAVMNLEETLEPINRRAIQTLIDTVSENKDVVRADLSVHTSDQVRLMYAHLIATMIPTAQKLATALAEREKMLATYPHDDDYLREVAELKTHHADVVDRLTAAQETLKALERDRSDG